MPNVSLVVTIYLAIKDSALRGEELGIDHCVSFTPSEGIVSAALAPDLTSRDKYNWAIRRMLQGASELAFEIDRNAIVEDGTANSSIVPICYWIEGAWYVGVVSYCHRRRRCDREINWNHAPWQRKIGTEFERVAMPHAALLRAGPPPNAEAMTAEVAKLWSEPASTSGHAPQ